MLISSLNICSLDDVLGSCAFFSEDLGENLIMLCVCLTLSHHLITGSYVPVSPTTPLKGH